MKRIATAFAISTLLAIAPTAAWADNSPNNGGSSSQASPSNSIPVGPVTITYDTTFPAYVCVSGPKPPTGTVCVNEI